MSTSATSAVANGLSSTQAGRLTEQMVGIEGFLNPLPGFRGTLKYRFSDFIVHEVDSNKQIVRLTNTSAASAEKGTLQQAATESTASVSDDQRRAALQALIGEEQAERVMELASLTAAGTAGDKTVVLKPELDKVKRTAVHQCIRNHFGNLGTDSVKVGESAQTAIRIFSLKGGGASSKDWGESGRPNKRQKGNDAIYQGRMQPPSDLKFLKFTLLKENYDTMSAISTIARLMHINPSVFTYAGTKDKRACTVQQVTAHKLDAGRLAGLNRQLRGMAVGDFSYCREPLKLGQLYGNRFKIVLRDVDADEAQVTAACDSLREAGFVNYYGLQRFGSSSIGTHDVGRAILRADWQAAADLILRPRAGEREEATKAREAFAAGADLSAAMRMFPPWMHVERQLLEGYRAHGRRAHCNAIQRVPRNMRLMYVHAYQSYIWNRMATERIRRHGHSHAVQGDLVLIAATPGAAIDDTPLDLDHPHHDAPADAGAAPGEKSVANGGAEADAAHAAPTATEEHGSSGRGKTKAHPKTVKALSASEAAAASIFDVVLPLPGVSVVYPENDIGEAYRAALKEDGVEWDKMQQLCGEYCLTGDYRHVLARPEDLSCSLVSYTDPRVDLQPTDLQLLRAAHHQARHPKANGSTEASTGPLSTAHAAPEEGVGGDPGAAGAHGTQDPAALPNPVAPAAAAADEAAGSDGAATLHGGSGGVDGPAAEGRGSAPGAAADEGGPGRVRRAVLLGVTLKASCYATMLIRELLKEHTDQAKLGLRE